MNNAPSPPPAPSAAAQWIDFLRYSLADIVVRGDWDDFGIFRILNRVSYISRHHLVFVVGFQRNLNHNPHYHADPITSSLDPIFQEMVLSSLKKLQHIVGRVGRTAQQQGFIELDPAWARLHAIQILGTQQFFIAFRVNENTKNVAAGHPARMSLEAIPLDSQLGRFMVEVMLPFDGKSTTPTHENPFASKRMKIEYNIDEQFSQLRRANKLRRATEDYPHRLKPKEQDSISHSIEKVTILVSAEYDRFSLSPLLAKGRKQDGYEQLLDNVLFFGKTFNRETVRHKIYRYDVRPYVPDKQKEQILNALSVANKSDYIGFDTRGATTGACDNEFWNLTKSTKGRERIVAYLTGPTPELVRTFLESVLMSGTVLVGDKFFHRSAIGWIDQDENPDEDILHEAFMYLCCLHFVLQFGSPVRPVNVREDLSIVALPFRCSGGIWMSGAYVRLEKIGPVDGLIGGSEFEENFLIYHSLFRDSERRLRRKAKELYSELLGDAIGNETWASGQRDNFTSGYLFLDSKSIRSFNTIAKSVTRVFPFETVELYDAESSGNSHIQVGSLGFRSLDNGFFDRLTLHQFLSEEESIGRLREKLIVSSFMSSGGINERDHQK